MSLFKKKIKVVTHSGSFHADDVLGCAALSLWAIKNNYALEIVRSRDPAIITIADIVLDVGMTYDVDKKRFDHHQKEGAGKHENSIPYASFGLIWKHYGEEICGDKKIADLLDKKIVAPIDAADNGINISESKGLGLAEYSFGEALCAFNLSWVEGRNENDQQFAKAVEMGKVVLQREIARAKAKIEGNSLTEKEIIAQRAGAILILDKYFNWEEAVSKYESVKLVVYPHQNGKDWCVQVGRDDLADYSSNRAQLPFEWEGLRDRELEEVSGILGAIFCARGGWFGVAETKEAALQMAKMALRNSQN